MAIDVTLQNIVSGFSLSKLNSNFTAIDTALQDGLSRSGTSPNQMATDIDMDGNDLLNIGSLSLVGGDTLEELVGYAEEWANKAEDSLVSAAAGGDQIDDYSSLHWANKGAANVVLTAADVVSTNADVVSTNADAVSTANDAVSTNADATAAAASAAAAIVAKMEWQGAWLTATAYALSDVIEEAGSSYICIVAHTSGVFATDLAALKWELVAQKGADGVGAGDLIAANNLSDVDNTSTSRDNLGLTIGTDVQAQDTDLQSLSDLTLAEGDVLYRNATVLTNLAKGTAAQVLTMNSGATAPEWATAASSGASLLDVRRNRIINPCMQISEENGNTKLTDTQSGCPAEMFFYGFGSIGGTASTAIQRVQKVTSSGAADRIRMTIETADATALANDALVRLYFNVEGSKVADLMWGTASAKDIVLRFEGSMPAGTTAIAIRNQPATHSYVVEIAPTTADTDQVFEITIPGPTVGTWATGDVSGMQICWTTACGSDYHTTAGAWQVGSFLGTSNVSNGLASTSNIYEIADVGLKLDPDSTGVYGQFEVPDPVQVALDCQRYLPTVKADNTQTPFTIGQCAATTIAYALLQLKVPSRVPVTGISYSDLTHFNLWSAGAGNIAVTGITFHSSGKGSVRFYFSCASGLAAGNACLSDFKNAAGSILFTGARM